MGTTIRRPTEKSTQKWKVTLMHQWPLGMSSESRPRGGEDVILLSFSAHSSHHIVSCGTSNHTTYCWCVGLVALHKFDQLSVFWAYQISDSSGFLVSRAYLWPFKHLLPLQLLTLMVFFIFRLLRNNSKVTLLWDSFPPCRKSLFPSAESFCHFRICYFSETPI